MNLYEQTYIYIYTHRESLVRNHEPCAKALGNNYIYVCHASAHAQDLLLVLAMGRHGFPGIPRRFCNLREASALMRISSIYIIIIIILYTGSRNHTHEREAT